MNIKPAWDTKPDMFEGSISNVTPQTQQSPLEEVGNGASHSIIEALEEHTVPLFNNNPLHGAMAEMVGGCPVEIRRSVIEKATQYGEADDNALYGLAVFDLYNEHLQPTGAVFTNPTIKGFKDIVFGHGGLYFNRSLKELLNEEITSAPKEIAALKTEFADLLVDFNKKIVIFVDNLDRCLPKQTIQTLESLRLFLFMPNTAFVIAADEDMVRHAVKEYFNGIDEKHITDYLDKLIQFPVKVPKISTREVRAYLFLLYASIHETYGKQKLKIESLRTGLENNLRLSWKEDPISVENALLLLDSDGSRTVNLLSDFTIADRIAPLLASSKSVEGNPRIVKRMLNVISMRNMIASARRMPVDLKLIAKMALFERCCKSTAISILYNEINATADGKPELFRQLEAVKNDLEAFEEKLPKDWKEHKTFLFDWINLEPSISDKDLRPLVYLSKETVPLRIVSRGLSEIADSAYRLLIRTSKVSSPSAIKAIGTIPQGEEKDVMRLILEELRQHSNWSEIPSGFAGAFLLAQELEETRPQFKAFISEVMPKLKPWFKSLIKEEVWFNN